jgi:hypothetical protein
LEVGASDPKQLVHPGKVVTNPIKILQLPDVLLRDLVLALVRLEKGAALGVNLVLA